MVNSMLSSEGLPNWSEIEDKGVTFISRSFLFDDYASVMSFAKGVAELADDNDHHPRMVIEWGEVRVDWWTHTSKGLEQQDFMMAEKTDALFEEQNQKI